MEDFSGELYLDTLFPNLKNSEIVNSSAKKSKEKIHSKEEKIWVYLDRLNKLHKKVKKKDYDYYLLEKYYNKYVISLDDAENELFKITSKNPNIDLTPHQVVDSQINSLTKWIEFLSDEEFAYPLWAKYLIFQSIVKIGNYIEEKNSYAKRSIKKTLSPFFEINEEAVYKAIKEIKEQVEAAGLNKDKIKKVIENGSFTDKYIEYYKKYKSNKINYSDKNDGIWKKYNEGLESEARRLFNDIKEKGTGWCTASDLDIAISQICGSEESYYPGGDFYVYFTKDSNGEYTIPRIAIRMNGHNEIGEIRGVANSQNMEDGLEDVIYRKLDEMALTEDESSNVINKIDNCKKLTKINQMNADGTMLSLEDIKFLYEIDGYIDTFGYTKDPRIEKIIKSRSILGDYRRLSDYNDKRLFLSKTSKYIPDKCIKSTHELDRDLLHICGIRILDNKLRDDRNLATIAIKNDPHSLELVSNRLKKDVDIVWTAVKRDAKSIRYASEEIRDNGSFMLKTMEKCIEQNNKKNRLYSNREFYLENDFTPKDVFLLASPRLKEHRKFIINSIKYSTDIFNIIDPKFKKDEEIVLLAFGINNNVIYHLDKEFYSDKEFCKKVIRKDGLFVNVFDNKIRNDKEIIEESISNNGLALQYYLSEELDYDMYLKGVQSNGLALEYVKPKYKTRELVYEAVSNNGLALEFCPTPLKKDRELIKKALSNNGLALMYVLKNDKSDLEYIEIAINSNKEALRYATIKGEEDTEFLLNCIKINPELIGELPGSLKHSRHFVFEAIKRNYKVYEYLPLEFKIEESFKRIHDFHERLLKKKK